MTVQHIGQILGHYFEQDCFSMIMIPMQNQEFSACYQRSVSAGVAFRRQLLTEIDKGAKVYLKLGRHEWMTQGGDFQLIESSWCPRDERRPVDPAALSRVAGDVVAELVELHPRMPKARILHAIWQVGLSAEVEQVAA